ncbi:MAG: sigma-54 dependent transcriptional regulator [Humidesulfovibrio sp.]|uniref:sigma-54-dependent transcriptional regulator n=1 Tax=Humidesulfovibrio sp. TaxID=2910988 RepID=UPI0027F64ACD|nr:sigma-54 dependent transcriptional regulator [Humidesulfovibrio sp.]MDQ7834932.1 sigma-54 dependent transcriptional regulator [Humidesulfovibrio sp.]
MTRVCIIDDDEFFGRLLASLLSGPEVDCAVARDLAQAEALLSESDFDVVFLDVRLPDGSGLDLAPRIKDLASAPELIIMTGLGDPDGAELAIRNGAWDYIQKTGSPEGLQLSFKRALEFRRNKQSAQPVERRGIVGESPRILEALRQMSTAARSSASVLIQGETGTGKEIFARAIHANSPRRNKNYVVVDCASLQEALVGSDLFGHRKGAFTGAVSDKAGVLQRADGGTLFLDEISELSLELQKSFLRLLETRTFRPLGDTRELRLDFRLVCASNKSLADMVAAGTFREDLFYRIRAAVLQLPPLRELGDDIVVIANHHLERICRDSRLGQKTLSCDLKSFLKEYAWPGNVRELIHVLEAMVASAPDEEMLLPAHLPQELRIQMLRARVGRAGHADPALQAEQPAGPLGSWNEYKKQEQERIELAYVDGLISLSGGELRRALEISGLSPSRLYGLLSKHGRSLGGKCGQKGGTKTGQKDSPGGEKISQGR